MSFSFLLVTATLVLFPIYLNIEIPMNEVNAEGVVIVAVMN